MPEADTELITVAGRKEDSTSGVQARGIEQAGEGVATVVGMIKVGADGGFTSATRSSACEAMDFPSNRSLKSRAHELSGKGSEAASLTG